MSKTATEKLQDKALFMKAGFKGLTFYITDHAIERVISRHGVDDAKFCVVDTDDLRMVLDAAMVDAVNVGDFAITEERCGTTNIAIFLNEFLDDDIVCMARRDKDGRAKWVITTVFAQEMYKGNLEKGMITLKTGPFADALRPKVAANLLQPERYEVPDFDIAPVIEDPANDADLFAKLDDPEARYIVTCDAIDETTITCEGTKAEAAAEALKLLIAGQPNIEIWTKVPMKINLEVGG